MRMSMVPRSRGRKKHIKFLAPTENPPFWTPRKSLCASFPGKERKKGTHINFFGGIFGVKNGVPNGPFSATKSLVYCFFLPLQKAKQQGGGRGGRGGRKDAQKRYSKFSPRNSVRPQRLTELGV